MDDFFDTVLSKLLRWFSYAIVTVVVFYLHSDACNNGHGVNFFAALIMWVVLIAVVYFGYPLWADGVCGALVMYFTGSLAEDGRMETAGFLASVGLLLGYLIAIGIIYFIILSVIRRKKAESDEEDKRKEQARAAGIEYCPSCGCTSIYFDPLGIPYENYGTYGRVRQTHQCTRCGKVW